MAKLIEVRAKIRSTLDTIRLITDRQLGELQRSYMFRDRILELYPTGNRFDFSQKYARLREYPDGRSILTVKLVAPKQIGHETIQTFSKEFKDSQERRDGCSLLFGSNVRVSLEYFRIGWSFKYEKEGVEAIIYVEDIENLGSTIEIEADSIPTLEHILSIIPHDEVFATPLPQVI